MNERIAKSFYGGDSQTFPKWFIAWFAAGVAFGIGSGISFSFTTGVAVLIDKMLTR